VARLEQQVRPEQQVQLELVLEQLAQQVRPAQQVRLELEQPELLEQLVLGLVLVVQVVPVGRPVQLELEPVSELD
jgi:hypothetical protein